MAMWGTYLCINFALTCGFEAKKKKNMPHCRKAAPKDKICISRLSQFVFIILKFLIADYTHKNTALCRLQFVCISHPLAIAFLTMRPFFYCVCLDLNKRFVLSHLLLFVCLFLFSSLKGIDFNFSAPVAAEHKFVTTYIGTHQALSQSG